MSENNLLAGAQNFLGMPSGTIQPQTPDAPRFRPGTDDFTDEEQTRRRAEMQAATQVLFRTDISKLDDDAVGGLYRASAKALFGIEDPDGTVAFGRKRAGDARHNVELLRQFCKGDYSLIRDPEYDSWRAMDEEQKFRHALENESKAAKVKGNLEGKRGASLWEMLALSGTSGAPGNQLPQETREDIQRRMDYDRLTPEEQEVYRKDVIGRYDRKIAKEQVLATFLAAKEGMSDRAAEMLANSYSRGEVDVDAVEALSDEDKDRFYTALSVMRGDQKKGHLLGIPTDFTDDTAVNRGQLALYGLQQSVLGLVSDTWEVGSSAAKWAYAKTLMDDQARNDYFRRWNAEARAKTALEQGLPEADTWMGEMVQALGENSHWFIPYAGIAKGGKMAREAAGTAGALLKSARAAKGAADLEKGMVNLWARQFASMERFTDALRDGAKAAGAVKGKMAGGAAMWTAGEASAFSAFANEYISNCDAAGVSREESVPMSAIVGLVNAKIESLYVPGLESTLTPAQVKNLMMMSGLRALKSDGAAGFRRWLGNYVEKGLVEGAKVTLTEGAVEEPLQQFVQEWGKEIAQSAEELKKSGRGELGLALGKFVYDNFAADGGFERFAQRNLETYVETAVDMIPSSVGFGLTTNGRQKLAQHRRNRAVRKMNMARWRADVAAAEAEGREAPPAPLMLGLDEQNRMTFNPNGVDYDEGVVDLVQREIDTRRLVGDYWEGKGETEAGPGEDNRYVQAMTEARRIWRSGQGDKVNRIAEAAGVDHTTAEVIAQYLQTEQETAAFSPRVREYVGLAVSAADFSEETIRTVLPGYVDGSFMADDANGVYTAKVKLGDGSERTIAYKVGDLSDELKRMIPENERPDSEFGRSYDAQLRRGSDRDATPWAQLSDAARHKIATDAALGTYGMTEGSGGVFQMTDAKGNAVTVNADEIVRLSNGKLADIGYTALATMGTARHETFHALWKFAAASYTEEQLQETAKALGLDVTADTWKVDLDEEMAHQMEEYASGHYVSHIAETRIEKLMDTGAGWFVRMFGQRGLGDEVKNAKTGKSFTLKDFYDAVLKGEIGSGELGVRHTATEAAAPKAEKGKATKSGVPVAVTDEERAQEAQDQAQAAAAAQPAEDEQRPEEAAPAAPRAEYTLNNPADATVPDARFYRVQAGDGVDIVGELVVSDANELKTSYKGTLEDGTLQNRAETEEGRALVEKIAGNPDPLQVGTVQPRANNGFIWATPSGNVFIGNTRETGITQAYARGNAENVRAYMINEARKRGLEIPEGVENPIVHFVLRDIQSKDGTAGIQDVVRLTNESVNRGMNVYEQAKNDADVMLKEKLVPGIELRADGRIDTERSAAAIGAFRRLTNAQGMIDADTGLLTEEGQTRLSNAVLAAFLASEDPTLTQKVIRDAGRLDMENERRALMRSAADLMALAEQKPQYDLRGPIAEALRYFTEWREADEAKRAEAGKTRRDWYARTKDGQRRRGIAWQEHMAQQDMFRRPSPAALIIGDLLAASRDLRSFEADDRETEAGKTRAQELVSRYLADFAQNARSANTETDDLFGAPPATVEEMLKAQRTKDGQRRFAVKAMNAAARRKDLLAVHNLDLGAIRKVAEIGGFAMPSIAVVKDSYVHSEFGDCTVLFDKSTIDPKRNRQNAIYSHDAWTPTFPKIVNEINVKAIEKANDGIMASLPEDVMDALRGDNYRLVYEDGMHDAWDSAEDAADAYADNLIMKAAYLVAKGEKVEPAMRPRKYLRGSRRVKVMGEDGLRTMHERLGRELIEFLDARGEVSEKRAAELAPRVEDVIRDAVWERDYRNDPDVVKNGFTKEQCVGFMFADAHLTWDEVTDIAEAVARYENDLKAGIADKGEVDEWGTNDAIRKRVDENDPEYRAWINSRYANPILSKGVYNGKERFDARGNRRSWRQLHSEATLENIVKAMKKTQREHGSGFLGRNPFGVAVRKFKSIDDMIANEDILREMTPDEEKAVKEELSGRLGDLVSEYAASQKSPDQNKFTAYDNAADMMFDAWEASRGSFAGMKKELNGWGYSADDDLAERIWRVFDEMSVMPTNYFEAKPQREVYFNEMKAWIVPDTISADERKILDGNGQRVFTYRKDDLADRLRAVNEAADRTGTRFSVCSIGGRSVAVAETEPLTTKEAKDEQKVREIISRVIGQSFDQVGEAVPVKVDAKFADEFWGSTTSQKLRDKLDKLWRAKVSAIPILKDIVGNTPLGPSEAAKHINARFKKRVKFYRCPSEFGIKRHDGVAIYKCELLVLEMDSGTRYVYDLVKMTKPTLTAKSSLDGDLVQRLYGQTNLTGESATKVPEGTAQSVPPSAGDVNGKRFSISNLYTGSAADYEKPSLVHVGKSHGVAFGWGIYATTDGKDGENFGKNVYEQTFFTNRAPGDESHLIEWDKDISPENQDRILDGLVSVARHNENLKKKIEAAIREEEDMFGVDRESDEYTPPDVDGMPDDILREAIEKAVNVSYANGREVYRELARTFSGKNVDSFDDRTDAYRMTSEFLRDECDIDGIKYPASMDGSAAENASHYVSFRDDNIRVDHKWVDGQKRFSFADPRGGAARREVYDRYHNADGTAKPGWLKEPNGKDTNLDPAQWVDVRTPQFTGWFGDWIKSEVTKRWFDVENADVVTGLSPVDVSSFAALPDKKSIADAFRGFGVVTNSRDGRSVRFPANSAGKMVYQKQFAAAFGDLFRTSVRAWSEKENPVEGHKPHANIENFHSYVNKFTDGNREFYVRFTVRENKDDGADIRDNVHAAEISDVSVYEKTEASPLPNNQTGRRDATGTGTRPHVDRKIAYFLEGIKNDSSKIVDGNGAPLVVYRGASFDPLAKEPGKGVIMPGAYFTADPEYAKRYGKVNAYYLNISNPLDVRNPAHAADLAKLLPPGYKFATGPMGALDWGEMASFDTEDLKEMGYDGIILDEGADYQSDGTLKNRGISYVPFDGGTQVKSATDNNGDYSLENRDVRFSIANLYTGSASDYEKPSLHYVGTGEGNQVYGWGLYASNQRGVAEGYAAGTQSDHTVVMVNGREWSPGPNAPRYEKIAWEQLDDLSNDVNDIADYCEMVANERDDQDYAKAAEWIRGNSVEIREPHAYVYEQTFFTNRAPGDESHLLKWYEPVSEENLERVKAQLVKEGMLEGNKLYSENGSVNFYLKGDDAQTLYQKLTWAFGDAQAASEFLARADIDGVKYPVDSYGGKTVKDGDTAGWNYVSFRDDNIRVDHKWVDGQKRFSLSVPSGPYSTDRLDVVLRGISGKKMMNDATGMVAVINSVQRRKIESNAAVRKSEKNGFTRDEHNAVASLVESLWKYAEPASTYPEGNGAPDVSIHRFVSVAKIGEREVFPYLTLKQTGTDDSRIYSIELEKIETLEGTLKDRGLSSSSVEGIVSKLRGKINNKKAGGLLYADTTRVTADMLEDATWSQLRPLAYGDSVKTPKMLDEWSRSREVADNISHQRQNGNGLNKMFSVALQDAIDRREVTSAEGGAKPKAKARRTPRTARRMSYAFPRLDQMSGDQLVATAVATQMALGKSDKVSDRSVKITTVQKLVKGIHPEWSTHQVGVEALRVATEAQKLARKIREDLDRGVSDSLVLQHLPDAVREQFGQEMTQQARQGARLGAYHQRAMSAVEDKQAKVIEEAVKVQSGIETKLLENAYGVDLSQTLMNLVANPFLKKDENGLYVPAGGGEETAQDQGEIVQADAPEKEVSDKARRAVDEVVAKSAEARAAEKANEKESERMRGRDQENASGSGGEEDASLEGADIVDIATRKQGLNLEDPRQLAHFVAELARRYWVDTHGLAKDANAWADSVAVQFLRKTAANVYGKLAQEIAYSQARDVAARSIDGFGNIPTVQGLISEMTYVGQVINARKIRETQQQLCERLDLFLREKMGAQGRFKPDNEELHRKVSAEIELRARYMRHAMWLTPDAASEEAKELQRQMDAATVDFKGEGHDAEQARVMVENLRKLNVLREFGSLRYKPVAQIEAAIQYWEDLERGSGDDIARENLDREIRTKKAAAMLAKAFHNPSRKYAREGKGVGDMLSDYLSSHMGFMNLLRDMTRYASKEDAAEAETILRYLELEIQKAGTKTEVEKRRHAEALASAVNSIYGRDFAKVLKEFAQKDDRFAPFMGAVDGHPVPPTKGRAIQLMVSLLQEGRKIEVEDPEHPGEFIIQWEGGYHDNIVKHGREKQAAEIAKLLTPADMNLVKWLGQWYEANRQELSQVCDSLFGIGVYAETSNYFPVKMLLEKQGLEKGEAVGWSIFPRALTPRVRNERDFDTSADVLQMFMSRMEEAAQWKAHAQLGLELRGIFGRSELQAAITSNHGNKVNQTVLGFVTDTLAGKGTVDRGDNGATYYTDMVRGWAALGALGANFGVMFKQTTSIPAFGFEIGLRKTASHIATAFTPEGMAAMRKIFDSDQRKVRWNTGNTEAVKNALANSGNGPFMRLWKASMFTNRLGDCVPALVVGQGIYREALENGMSEEDAMAYTWMLVERTQQSGRIENQAQFQRRSKFGRAIYQFLSTQQQYLQYEVRALRGVVAKPGDLGKWGDLARAAVLNHFILSSAYFWMGALFKRALGQEPPEDELKDWVVSMLIGPYGALYGLGFTCTGALNEWIKGPQYGGSTSSLPSLSFVGNVIVRDPAAIVKSAFDETKTWDDVLEKMGRFGADANALFRDLRKLKKNYWDD